MGRREAPALAVFVGGASSRHLLTPPIYPPPVGVLLSSYCEATSEWLVQRQVDMNYSRAPRPRHIIGWLHVLHFKFRLFFAACTFVIHPECRPNLRRKFKNLQTLSRSKPKKFWKRKSKGKYWSRGKGKTWERDYEPTHRHEHHGSTPTQRAAGSLFLAIDPIHFFGVDMAFRYVAKSKLISLTFSISCLLIEIFEYVLLIRYENKSRSTMMWTDRCQKFISL